MSKLLIIGNGFDLHCGLDSSYHHFYDYLMKDSSFSRVYDYLHDNSSQKTDIRTNILWALLIAYHDNRNEFMWKDIETIISSFIYEQSADYRLNLNDLLDYIQKYTTELRNLDKTTISNSNSMMKFLWLIYRGKGLDDICDFRTTADRGKLIAKPKDTNSIIDLFYKDLKEIETKFAHYLGLIHNSYPKIHSIANKTLAELLEVYESDEDTDEKKTNDLATVLNSVNILSFNYTRLGQPNGVDFKYYKNIHGTILDDNNDMIFGIDSFDIDPMDPVFKFTKTYRVSMLESKLSNNIPNLYNGTISLNDIEQIIIYGHSLNYQDNSYYYAVFKISVDKQL